MPRKTTMIYIFAFLSTSSTVYYFWSILSFYWQKYYLFFKIEIYTRLHQFFVCFNFEKKREKATVYPTKISDKHTFFYLLHCNIWNMQLKTLNMQNMHYITYLKW